MNNYSPDQPIPQSLLFQRFATALREVSVIVTRLETVTLPTDISDSLPSIHSRALQDFDLILQSLADLVQMAETIGQKSSALTNTEYLNLVAELRLAWLRNLVGGMPPDTKDHNDEVALF